jgi:ATP-binding cassette subfamily B protein
MDVFKFGLGYWKKYLLKAGVIQIISFVALTADLLIPLLSAMFINYVILSNDPVNDKDSVFGFLLSGDYGQVHTMKLFFSIATVFMALILVKLILVYIKNVNNQKLGLGLETDLRIVTFKKLMELDSKTISEYNTGELLQTINQDTIMLKEMFCRMVPNMFDSVFVLILSIYILSTVEISLIIIPVLLTPFFVVALLKFKKFAKANYGRIRGNNSLMNLTVQENIEAVRLVRSFTNEDKEREKFDEANENLKNSHIKQIKLSASFEVVFSSIKQIAYIGSIAVSAYFIMRGDILVGSIAAASSYVLKIMDYISMINNTLFQMQQMLVSGQKMKSFMECESKIPDGSEVIEKGEPIDIQVVNGSMVLDGKQVLQGINLSIPYGKKVGIVGGTGSGKSVLLESLVRIHDLTGGEIEVNGKSIRDYSLESLREMFSYVFQDVFLFSNTIDSNIAYAEPDIEKDQVVQAAKHAQAHSFIKNLESGYDTIVGERGLGISGGQKQRVSIARALLKNAPIIVLDDSTSALDVETEKKLLAEIKEEFPEKTLLISAHRISSVVDCDEIIYMQDGVIMERGSFAELMKLNGHFASVYNIQESQRKAIVNFDDMAGSEVYNG